jgi:hypothetical protein
VEDAGLLVFIDEFFAGGGSCDLDLIDDGDGDGEEDISAAVDGVGVFGMDLDVLWVGILDFGYWVVEEDELGLG